MAMALDLAPGLGNQIDYTLGGTVSAGDVIVVSNSLLVALMGGSSGERVTAKMGGKFRVSKASGAISRGDKLFWDAGNSRVSTTATVGLPFGVAAAAAVSGDATVDAFLGIDPVKQAAVVAAFTMGTNVTAATANDSLEDSASTNPTEANFNNNMKEIGTKVNAILTALKNAGIMANS